MIIKPLKGCCGSGIKIIKYEDLGEEALLCILSGYKITGIIAEELVQQVGILRDFHPQSVNTVRINTVRYSEDDIECIWSGIRIGSGDSIVDNIAAGGLFAGINEENGVTERAGDTNGFQYDVHPDTKVPLVDVPIPEWDQVCMLVKKMANLLPGAPYVGWDMAYSNKGWVMIEANGRPDMLYQSCFREHVRPDFERIKKKLQDSCASKK